VIENCSRFFSVHQSPIDVWCDRRCLSALRRILAAYPMLSGLTDKWGELATAIENVRAFARDHITGPELQSVEEAPVFARRAEGL
jgi:hypothetical protein